MAARGYGPIERFFFYGTLREREVLEQVLGRPVPDRALQPARLPGFAVHKVRGEGYPMLVLDPASMVEGILVEGVTAGEVARLLFFEDGDNYEIMHAAVALEDGRHAEAALFRPTAIMEAEGPWDFEEWRREDGGLLAETLKEFMEWFGRRSADEAHELWKWAESRALARLEGRRGTTPAILRRRPGPGDVQRLDLRRTESGVFALEDHVFRHRRFDGAMSGPVRRMVFHTGDSVTVLPWDPAHDTVLVIEQFRAAPFARDDANPWLIEPIAGRRDGPESFEEVARREAAEEAGIGLGRLERIAGYYPSPGALAEFLVSYVAEAALGPAGPGGVHGLAAEGEDIRAHIVALDDLLALVESGEVNDGPLILSALWLKANHARLRDKWGHD